MAAQSLAAPPSPGPASPGYVSSGSSSHPPGSPRSPSGSSSHPPGSPRSPRRRLNSQESAKSRAAGDSDDEDFFPSGGGGPLQPRPRRARINSHPSDIPRTYSGLYGTGGEAGDLLPFELTRNRNTDWIDTATPFLLLTYLFIIIMFELTILAVLGVPHRLSWTVTNVVHGFITMTYLHWIKGSPNFYEQGEMNAMTTWEQLDASPEVPRDNQKRALFIVPTVLCHVACHFAEYDKVLCLVNLSVWVPCIVAKMSFMNGVRILGINRTTGIDDDTRKRD